jgi:dolichol-phosphate mannosyltransferase
MPTALTTRRTLHILITVLNEAGNIERLLGDILTIQECLAGRYGLRMLLVDDGSTDGTAEIARRVAGRNGVALEVLTHSVNRGPGMAFASGFTRLASLMSEDDWLVTMEGDNTSRCELLEQMLQRTGEGYDVVFASPYMYGGGILQTSRFRLFLSHMSNTFVREFLGIHGILTVSSFFRLYRSRVIRDLQSVWGPGIIERSGFESMIELTMKLVHRGVHLSEVPMVLDTSKRVGRSKMKILRTIRGYITMPRDRPRWCRPETRRVLSDRPSRILTERVFHR